MPAAPGSGLTRTIYNTVFKKNSVFVTSIFAGALAFEVAYDTTTDKIWENLNKGKLWKDVQEKLENSE